jgi:hypothetical protein
MQETIVPQAFLASKEFPLARHARVARTLRCGRRAPRPPRRDGGGARGCPRFIKRSRCFSHCAVVIGVQCRSIRDCTVPKSPSLWLGGQYGEKSQIEDEVRGEEDCAEDQAQGAQEEVSLRCGHAIGVQVASRGVASVGGLQVSMRNAAAGPADKVDGSMVIVGALGSTGGVFIWRPGRPGSQAGRIVAEQRGIARPARGHAPLLRQAGNQPT